LIVAAKDKLDAVIGPISQIFRNNSTIQPASELYAASKAAHSGRRPYEIFEFCAFDEKTGDWFANSSEY